MKSRVIVSWSGGKDSALALYEVIRSGVLEPVGLLTTVTREYDRVTMHGVRRLLVEEQASALGIPLDVVYIPGGCSMEEYGEIMRRAIGSYRCMGVEGFVFGDIFLEDVRRYREEKLESEGFKCYFPLWGRDTRGVISTFIELGFKAVVVCVDSRILDKSFVGRLLDQSFLEDLPEGVDPCGERGEFHTFVFDGPIFRRRIDFEIGEIVLRDSFYYCDLIPLSDSRGRLHSNIASSR